VLLTADQISDLLDIRDTTPCGILARREPDPAEDRPTRESKMSSGFNAGFGRPLS
jgi:hypothetical protein